MKYILVYKNTKVDAVRKELYLVIRSGMEVWLYLNQKGGMKMKQCIYCHVFLEDGNEDQCPDCKQVTSRLKGFMKTKMGMEFTKHLVSTLGHGVDVAKVLILTQNYGSHLVDASGYNMIGDSTKSEENRKKAKETLTLIAKQLAK